eukprot:1066119-Rhodomonas_salina.1
MPCDNVRAGGKLRPVSAQSVPDGHVHPLGPRTRRQHAAGRPRSGGQIKDNNPPSQHTLYRKCGCLQLRVAPHRSAMCLRVRPYQYRGPALNEKGRFRGTEADKLLEKYVKATNEVITAYTSTLARFPGQDPAYRPPAPSPVLSARIVLPDIGGVRFQVPKLISGEIVASQ